jgi:ATP-dependent DNA helicase RecQ
MAEWLKRHGVTALPYHAGMTAEQRKTNQQRFLREDGIVMVATVAFGMGIDKPDVRFVAHLDLPSSIEAYYQETGRAGRDGAPANAWMAFGRGDLMMLRKRIADSNAPEQRKRVEQAKLDAMLRYCEANDCRRMALLGYFDEATQPCGNCDLCLEPRETWDATIPARKLLSAILRTGQRFGISHVTDVLRGNATEKVLHYGHNNLPTFAVGEDLAVPAWRSIAQQMTALGYLKVEGDGFNVLTVSDTARPILKGAQTLLLRQVPDRKTRRRKRDGATVAAAPGGLDPKLWDALRARRRDLAAEQNVPTYVIFHDTTLAEIGRRKPKRLSDFLDIPGVGERKLQRYGAAFMAVIADFG